MSEVTILGKGPSWKKCPFTGEIWAVATVLTTEEMKDRHYDKVFAFDRDEDPLIAEPIAIAKERGIPLVSTLSFATEPYPIWGVINKLGTQYFQPSVSYMIALAIYKGYTTINLYGVDQTNDNGRGLPFVAFWIGMALGRGITIQNASHCTPYPISPKIREMIKERVRVQGEYHNTCSKC